MFFLIFTQIYFIFNKKRSPLLKAAIFVTKKKKKKKTFKGSINYDTDTIRSEI